MHRMWPFALLMGLVLIAQLALGAEFAYLSPRHLEALTTKFAKAGGLHVRSRASQFSGLWICDLYGLRSRMQMESGLKLYHLQTRPDSEQIENIGAQIVKSYAPGDQGLTGTHGPVVEELRITENGHLMGLLRHGSGEHSKLLAISDCTRDIKKN